MIKLHLVLLAFLVSPVVAITQGYTLVHPHSTHIARLTKDSIIVVNGETYSYTVDTPEDKGLISTSPTVGQLLTQLRASEPSLQLQVRSEQDTREAIESVVIGDRLVVLNNDGEIIKTYHIGSAPAAIGGKLVMKQDS